MIDAKSTGFWSVVRPCRSLQLALPSAKIRQVFPQQFVSGLPRQWIAIKCQKYVAATQFWKSTSQTPAVNKNTASVCRLFVPTDPSTCNRQYGSGARILSTVLISKKSVVKSPDEVQNETYMSWPIVLFQLGRYGRRIHCLNRISR